MRKSIVQLFGGNLLSKLLGLGREVLTAALFGTGQEIGAYRVAQTSTLVPINFLTSDSLNSAFVPKYKSLMEVSQDYAQTLFWSLFTIFIFFSFFLSIILWQLADLWVGTIAPGLDSDTSLMAVEMLRVMAIGIPFYLLSALLMFLGMAHSDFIPMAVRPSIQNIGLIIGAALAFLLKNAIFLAWGFVLSYAFFGTWSALRAYKSKLLCWPEKWVWLSVKEVLTAFWKTLRPLLFLPLLLQGNIAVERAVASLIGLSVVSSIDYAKFVSETLILLVSVPIAFSGLGYWSGLKHEEMNEKLKELFSPVLLISISASLFLATNSGAVIDVIYSRGAFDAASVDRTSDILFGISIGLWAQVLGYVLIKALNAQLRNGAVLRVMAVALFSNVIFNLVFYPYLGAMTLGVGNSIYGLVLLGGTLTALGLWRAVLIRGWSLAVAAFGYLLLGYSLPQLDTTWLRLFISIIVALIYWTLFILIIPDMRQSVISMVVPKSRKNA